MLYNKAIGATASAQKIYIEDVFSTYLYTGNSSTQTITNGIDLSGKGGLVWTKQRSAAVIHTLIDTIRGAGNYLVSSSTQAEFNVADAITSFGSSGYSLGSRSWLNGSSETHVSWTFRKAAKFFDVVTWTAVGTSGNRRISHNLGSVPGCIIIKATNATDAWYVYHRSEGRSKYLKLNSTDASVSQTDAWGTSDPTSTDFGFAENIFSVPGWTYVAYLFAHDAGGFGDSGNDNVISCGSFTTNGSGAATVSLGWEPQFGIIKSIDTGSWIIQDSIRGIPVDGRGAFLATNASSAEGVFNGPFYLLPNSTGFRTELSSNTTYIYIAIRRGPMKTPTDATKVFSVLASSGAPGTALTTNFPVDMQIYRDRITSDSNYSVTLDRLRGVSTTDTQAQSPFLATSSTAAENASFGTTREWSNTGFDISSLTGGLPTIFWNFRRAPGFFDVVAYTGTGSALTVSHNLGVTPELWILKRRNSNTFWPVWVSGFSSSQYFSLSSDGQRIDDGSSFPSFQPSSTSLTIGTSFPSVNASGGTYISYLFATCPGVSKVGSYTGTGTTKQIDCGFTNGARFVLIKRTDNTGDWYVWDTARGIVSGNDNYLLLNSTAAEVTNTDYIDPLSSGFEISSTAPAAINANGGSYIFLAIA